MRVIAAGIMLAVLALVPRPEPPRELVKCHIDAVTDGDTIKVDICLPFPPGMVLHDQDTRLQGYDAWESSKRRTAVRVTDAEVRKGKIATAELQALVAEAEQAYLSPVEEGQFSYGRTEAYLLLWNDGELIEVKDWMQAHGHCRPVEVGATAPDDDWRDDVIIPAGD